MEHIVRRLDSLNERQEETNDLLRELIKILSGKHSERIERAGESIKLLGTEYLSDLLYFARLEDEKT